MSADLLRRAASRLRETAADATRGPWVFYQTMTRDRENEFAWTITRSQCANDRGECEPDCGRTVLQTGAEHCEHDAMTAEDAAWIALMHPGVAEPIAEWLELFAAMYDQRLVTSVGSMHALAVADAILGDPKDEASDRSGVVASDASPAAAPVQASTGPATPGEAT